MPLPLDPPKHYDMEGRVGVDPSEEDGPTQTAAPTTDKTTTTDESTETTGATEEEPTKEELYEEAQELDVEGRSTMDKDELQEAVEKAASSKKRGNKK